MPVEFFILGSCLLCLEILFTLFCKVLTICWIYRSVYPDIYELFPELSWLWYFRIFEIEALCVLSNRYIFCRFKVLPNTVGPTYWSEIVSSDERRIGLICDFSFLFLTFSSFMAYYTWSELFLPFLSLFSSVNSFLVSMW